MPELNEEQQEVWDKLNYVPPEKIDFDINSMYSNVFGIQRMEPPEGKTYTMTVLKNRCV